jgi:hypothetical protein
MPLGFGRRRGEHATSTNGATTTSGGFMSRFGGRSYGSYPDALNSRPTFGQWLKGVWIDILTMAALGAIGLGVRFVHILPCDDSIVDVHRSITQIPLQVARFQSPSKMGRSYIRNSPIHFAGRSFRSGQQRCWLYSSQSSSSWSAR